MNSWFKFLLSQKVFHCMFVYRNGNYHGFTWLGRRRSAYYVHFIHILHLIYFYSISCCDLIQATVNFHLKFHSFPTLLTTLLSFAIYVHNSQHILVHSGPHSHTDYFKGKSQHDTCSFFSFLLQVDKIHCLWDPTESVSLSPLLHPTWPLLGSPHLSHTSRFSALQAHLPQILQSFTLGLFYSFHFCVAL